jgi:hypothetical protein
VNEPPHQLDEARTGALMPRCLRCGYTLKGLRPDQCPECGDDLTLQWEMQLNKPPPTILPTIFWLAGFLWLIAPCAGMGLTSVYLSASPQTMLLDLLPALTCVVSAVITSSSGRWFGIRELWTYRIAMAWACVVTFGLLVTMLLAFARI